MYEEHLEGYHNSPCKTAEVPSTSYATYIEKEKKKNKKEKEFSLTRCVSFNFINISSLILDFKRRYT